MKVIFVDVDGVLNSHKTIRKFGHDFIDPILVALVERIVRETGAKIVISSSWRIDPKDMEKVRRAFSNVKIFDQTPRINRDFPNWVERKEEIQSWLDHHQVSKFAIIDDEWDAEIEGSFFHTDCEIGLTAAIADQIIQHLKN